MRTDIDYEGFHATTIDVRDYECDLEGIVNNAVYLHYLEHGRHELLKSCGTSFAGLHSAGIDPVVVRVEIDYLGSLGPGDRCVVYSRMRRKGVLRFIFDQHIVRPSDGAETTRAAVIGTFVKNGRPVPAPAELEPLFEMFSTEAV